MREILVSVTCDGCATKVGEEEAVNVEFDVGRTTYETDLCAGCILKLTSQARVKKRRAGRNSTADKLTAEPTKPQRKR